MNKAECDEMAALVVSVRRDVEELIAKGAALEAERNELAAHVSAHVDALKQSNAQCGEYLRKNEQLRAELATARVSAASLERIQATAAKWGASGQEDAGHFIERTATDLEFMRLAKDEMQNKLAETTKDLAYSRLAVDTMCARDKRFKETGARCGAKDGEDIGDFIERSYADRNKMHSQLVEVRAALASVSEERDSLRRTLQEWEEEETKPHVRVTADDIADHVVPPVLPDELEFRSVVPTPEMLTVCSWWEVQGAANWICFKHKDQRPVVWRSMRGDAAWKYEDCPQPLKPNGMTWQKMDEALSSKNEANSPAPDAERPLCDKCHTCGMTLEMRPGKIACRATLCRSNVSDTMMWDYDVNDIAHPYHEPCRSRHPVRHE